MSDQEYAAAVVRSGKNVFITGKAGTGKSTLLRTLRAEDPGMLVCAPTGLAALNVNGVTIHSAFRINPKILDPLELDGLFGAPAEVLRSASSVVVDEVSMVRSDLLAMMDARLREVTGRDMPFGGKQMILIGDPFQLPPVVTDKLVAQHLDTHYGGPFFFQNPLISEARFHLVELEKVYRQSDPVFLQVLNSIRSGQQIADALAVLDKSVSYEPQTESVVLTATNADADRINESYLVELPGEFQTLTARVVGSFSKSSYPTDEYLTLKVGARVMTLRNGSGYRNGTTGVVEEIGSESVKVRMDFSQSVVSVERASWDSVKYELDTAEKDKKKRKLKLRVVGSFIQFPLRLAWAMTIHKSQGQTLDKVHVQMGRGAFAAGQTYVALSRCTTLEGLTLAQPLSPADVFVDPAVLAFRDHFERD